ncbi:unnamed protein product [Brassica rapa]|uniref:Uncharacterized protein n=1 Tax=Brassica campestris TaxID=3711 RepID=A0A3P6AD45_BRACM|nr:unnamed protein product [Brassica rapa]VDC82101.1 unnamed protein product [Brassica rapa]
MFLRVPSRQRRATVASTLRKLYGDGRAMQASPSRKTEPAATEQRKSPPPGENRGRRSYESLLLPESHLDLKNEPSLHRRNSFPPSRLNSKTDKPPCTMD